MTIRTFRLRAAVAALALAAAGTLTSVPLGAEQVQHASLGPVGAVAPTQRCDCPPKLAQFDGNLSRISRLLQRSAPVTIVALGSSSTAGAMASAPERSYPSRLAVELKKRFPQVNFRVVNRGRNGDSTEGMVARMDAEVFSEKPDLVIWQLGTNSVLRDESLMPVQEKVVEGLERIRASGADLILIDPQFAPRVTAKPDANKMVNLIGALAAHERIPLFRRFAIMRHWHDGGMPFSAFLDKDDLHHNDWGYGCMARLLARMITDHVVAEAKSRQQVMLRLDPPDEPILTP